MVISQHHVRSKVGRTRTIELLYSATRHKCPNPAIVRIRKSDERKWLKRVHSHQITLVALDSEWTITPFTLIPRVFVALETNRRLLWGSKASSQWTWTQILVIVISISRTVDIWRISIIWSMFCGIKLYKMNWHWFERGTLWHHHTHRSRTRLGELK